MSVGTGVLVGVSVGVFVGGTDVFVGVSVGVSVTVGVEVSVGTGVFVGVSVGVSVGGIAVFVGVSVGVSVGGTLVLVGVSVGVSVGGTGVFVDVSVGVLVGGTEVFVGVLVEVLVGVFVADVQEFRVEDVLRGLAPDAEKSVELLSVSVQPFDALLIELVLLGAGAAEVSLQFVPEPYPTKSTTDEGKGQPLPDNSVVEETNATFPAVAFMLIDVPETKSGLGRLTPVAPSELI